MRVAHSNMTTYLYHLDLVEQERAGWIAYEYISYRLLRITSRSLFFAFSISDFGVL
jgi:hypothetical protein